MIYVVLAILLAYLLRIAYVRHGHRSYDFLLQKIKPEHMCCPHCKVHLSSGSAKFTDFVEHCTSPNLPPYERRAWFCKNEYCVENKAIFYDDSGDCYGKGGTVAYNSYAMATSKRFNGCGEIKFLPSWFMFGFSLYINSFLSPAGKTIFREYGFQLWKREKDRIGWTGYSPLWFSVLQCINTFYRIWLNGYNYDLSFATRFWWFITLDVDHLSPWSMQTLIHTFDPEEIIKNNPLPKWEARILHLTHSRLYQKLLKAEAKRLSEFLEKESVTGKAL